MSKDDVKPYNLSLEDLRMMLNLSIRYGLQRNSYVPLEIWLICKQISAEVWDNRTWAVATADIADYLNKYKWDINEVPGYQKDCYRTWFSLYEFLMKDIFKIGDEVEEKETKKRYKIVDIIYEHGNIAFLKLVEDGGDEDNLAHNHYLRPDKFKKI